MPQMSPMWWTLIYTVSTMIFLSTMILMFFYKNNLNKKLKIMNYFNKTNKNWKW
uniref:ATP synthase F0 subunit 8 n=1 Tax=Stephanitis nashi TaxID=763235 RepID=UPI0023D87FC4|nr:ATP synthase F0 subunit 8 [Stephanitis nashi]WCS41448.1 ATP synthase F0 subunit 8 [Stephanitis nashi]